MYYKDKQRTNINTTIAPLLRFFNYLYLSHKHFILLMDKTILVLTDFSINAYDAAVFACQIAKENSYTVHLLHYYTTKSTQFDEEKDNPEHKHSVLLKADLLMIELYGKLEAAFPGLTLSISCQRGLLEEKLRSELDAGNYKCIVMGVKGESQHTSVLWGSTTAMITEKSDIPVWVIPIGHDTYRQNKVGLLTNFKPEELTTLRTFGQINGNIKEVSLIHVIQEGDNERDIKNRLDTWLVNFENWDTVDKVKILIEQTEGEAENAEGIPQVITHTLIKEGLEALIITKTRRSFFRRLFEKSISKTLANELVVPTFFDK